MAVQRKQFDDLAKMVKEVITEEFASRLFARTVKQLPVIRENAKVLSRAAGKILKSQRLGDQYGSFLAGTYSLVSGERLSEEDAEKWLVNRSEEHTSELQSLMRISYAVFCLKKKYTRK